MYIYKNGFTGENFLKNLQNPIAAKYLEDINSSCDKFRKEPIKVLPFSKFRIYEETGSRAEYQMDYFAVRRRMTMFMLRTWLFKEAEDIKELEDILWAVCDEYSWVLPAHLPGILTDEDVIPEQVDLFAAETAHTIAETLSICGELIHPAVARRCINEVFRRVIEPFEADDIEKYHTGWEFLGGNWSAVCGGSVGMTALYLIEDGERLKKITDRTKAACNRFINTCEDDGVCTEGVTYWMYAMQYYVAFDELLQKRTGESIVTDEKKLRKLAEFPSVACMANNIPVRFSDCSDTHLFFGILCKLYERYGTPVPEQSYFKDLIDRCARTCGAVRTIEWFDPELLHNNSRTDDIFLPLGQWAVLHNTGMTAAIKGGHNNEPHNHNDVGSYMLIKEKSVLADDLGAAKYTHQYFSENRYSFLNTGSHGHNLPVVNGCNQLFGEEYAADKFEKTAAGIRISFADAYGKEADLKSLVRDLTLDENGFKIKDSFEFTKSVNTVAEHIITKLDAEITDKKSVSLFENGKSIGTIELLTDGKINISEGSYLMVNASGRSDEYSAEDNVQKVTIIEFECVTDTDKTEISYIIK